MSSEHVNTLLCFLDIETTGKNRQKDELWSCSFQIDLIEGSETNPIIKIESVSPLQTFVIKHSKFASTWVLNNTDYLQYFELSGDTKQNTEVEYKEQHQFIQGFLKRLEKLKQEYNAKMFLVGANPAFDNSFLERLKNEFLPEEEMPWDFHLIDIEQMCYASSCRTNLKPPSLAKCVEIILGRRLDKNYTHNSQEDVLNTKEVFYKLLLG
jgi:hypothetical protein